MVAALVAATALTPLVDALVAAAAPDALRILTPDGMGTPGSGKYSVTLLGTPPAYKLRVAREGARITDGALDTPAKDGGAVEAPALSGDGGPDTRDIEDHR